MRRAVLAASLVALVACEQDTDLDRGLESFRLEPVARFGTRGDGGAALTRVAGLVPSEDEVFVLEASPPRIAVFDDRGSWLRDIGRRGDGPGEFRRPQLIGISGEDVWVGDPTGGRLEIFQPTGASVSSMRWSIPPDSLGTRAVPMGLFADGSVLAGPENLPIGAVTSGALTHRNYFRADRDGVSPALVYREEIDADDFMTARVSDGTFIVGAHPLRYSPLVSLYPDGSGLVVVEPAVAQAAEDAAYRLAVIAPSGSTTVDVFVRYDPVEATGWLDAYLLEMEREMLERSASVDRPFLRALREGLAPRTFYPPATSLVAGADGTIWVERGGPAADSTEWQIFNRAGSPLGTLAVRHDLQIHHASLEEVWAELRDEYDVPFIWRFQVVRLGGAP